MMTEFNLIFGVIVAILGALFLAGKGKKILDLFGGNRQNPYDMRVKKKRTKAQERKYQKVIGIFCMILAVGLILMYVLAKLLPYEYYMWFIIGDMVLVVVLLIWVGIYMRKNFPDY